MRVFGLGVLLFAAAGCGSSDPCDGITGACVSLTLRSTAVQSVDALSITAFGETQPSTSKVARLPVRLAIVPPAQASGAVTISVQASLAGMVVGSGQTTVQLTAGHVQAAIDLAAGASCGDTSTDPHNCGACGHDCTTLPNVITEAGVTCGGGHCVVPDSACRPGFAHCSSSPDDGCEADLSQSSHCGSCNACPTATPLCSAGGASGSYACTANCQAPTPDRCGNSCTNLQSDPAHCKTCETVCSYPHAAAVCMQGSCTLGDCEKGYLHCSSDPTTGCETYVMGNDANNCGGCNLKCKVGQVCNAGACQENQVTCASPGITCRMPGCYQAGRYSISAGGGIVVDLNNGRRLYTRATRGPLTHTNASNDCKTLVLEGINGWRLPAYDELATTLYMAGGLQGCPTCDPAVDQAAFNDTPADTGYYLTDTFNSTRMGWNTVYYCDGRNNYQNDNATPVIYRCLHDPLP